MFSLCYFCNVLYLYILFHPSSPKAFTIFEMKQTLHPFQKKMIQLLSTQEQPRSGSKEGIIPPCNAVIREKHISMFKTKQVPN